MNHAIKEALKGKDEGEVPVGCVLVYKDTIVAKEHNNGNQGCLGHAEMKVLNKAISYLKTPYLNECSIFVTLEPCPMCASAIAFTRIKALYYGAYDTKGGAVEHGAQIFKWTPSSPKIIVGGICEEECSSLLKEFFKDIRTM
ncbi:MAG: nucleoside deaminase [Alphaproteobacteria bacterium]